MTRKGRKHGRGMAYCVATSILGFAGWRIYRRYGRYVSNDLGDAGTGDGTTSAIHRSQRKATHRRESQGNRRRAFAHFGVTSYAIAVVCRIVLAQWWDPLAWWNSLVGFFHGISDDIIAFIHLTVYTAIAAITKSLDFVTKIIEDAINAAHAAISALVDSVNAIWGWIEAAAETVGGWIQAGLDGFWNDVISPAIKFVGDAATWAIGELRGLYNDLNNAFQWVVNNVIDPIAHWVETAADTVGHWILDGLSVFYRDFVAPIVSDLASALHLLGTIWDWFIRYAEILGRLAEKLALGLIEWIIDPEGQIRTLAQSVEGQHWISWAANAADDVFTTAEGWTNDVMDLFQ